MEKIYFCRSCSKIVNTGKYCQCKKKEDDESDDLIKSFVNVTMEDYFEACKPIRSASTSDQSVEVLLEDAQSTTVSSRNDLLVDFGESTGAKKKNNNRRYIAEKPNKMTTQQAAVAEKDSNHLQPLRSFCCDPILGFYGRNCYPSSNKPRFARNRKSFDDERSSIPVRKPEKDTLFQKYYPTHKSNGNQLYKRVENEDEYREFRKKGEDSKDCESTEENSNNNALLASEGVTFDEIMKAFEIEKNIRLAMCEELGVFNTKSPPKMPKPLDNPNRLFKLRQKEDKRPDPTINPSSSKSSSSIRTAINIENSPLGIPDDSFPGGPPSPLEYEPVLTFNRPHFLVSDNDFPKFTLKPLNKPTILKKKPSRKVQKNSNNEEEPAPKFDKPDSRDKEVD